MNLLIFNIYVFNAIDIIVGGSTLGAMIGTFIFDKIITNLRAEWG